MKKAKKTVLSDWREKTMSRIRALIKQAAPEAVEEVKWRTASNPGGVLVWFHGGMICTGETYKNHLRLTFSKGASLKDHDSKGFINTYRAMVIHEDDKIDEHAFKELIRAAVALNRKTKGGSKSRQDRKQAR